VAASIASYHNGQEFLAGFQATFPGCVILDTYLSAMGSLMLLKKALKKNPYMPVIMIASPKQLDIAKRATLQQIFAVLIKPFSKDLFLETVKQAIALAQRLAALSIYPGVLQLIPREQQLLSMHLQGMSHTVIAANLWMAIASIDRHFKHILAKLSFKDLGQLTILQTFIQEQQQRRRHIMEALTALQLEIASK
jgi:FixJ family two-component response regulator